MAALINEAAIFNSIVYRLIDFPDLEACRDTDSNRCRSHHIASGRELEK